MSQYCSLAEFKQAPTGIDVSSIDQQNIGNQSAQDAALTMILKRASSWIEQMVQIQTMEATQYTNEIKEVNMTRDGRINIHPQGNPLVSVSSVSYKFNPQDTWTTVATANIIVRDTWFTCYNQLPITFNENLLLNTTNFFYGLNTPYFRRSDIPLLVQYSYVAGYTNTALTATANAGTTTLTVGSTIGIVAGITMLTIPDGPNTEYVQVSSINAGANTVTLTKPLIFSHAIGISVTAVPDAIRQACILLAGYLIKDRGSVAVTMQEASISSVNQMGTNNSSDIELARQMLLPFQRMVSSI